MTARLQRAIASWVDPTAFVQPDLSMPLGQMRACAALVLSDDVTLAADALRHVQQEILTVAINNAAGVTLAEKLKDKSIRPILEQYSLLTSGMRKRDHDLARRKDQS